MKNTFLLTLLCLIGFSAIAQEMTVTGVITDKSDGAPIPGVSVSIKGTTVGTITDLDGNYTVKANNGDILIFSFIGYGTQEIPITKEKLDVLLAEDTHDVGEVVVVGYGVQKKSVVTASISSIKSEEIEKVSTGRVEAALQGRSAGISILPTSGAPGASSKIRIRGTGSNGSSSPLFIVDGMKTDDISDINPNDIKSTEILKDAASAAIYGTEGANGVVLITTKTGKKGKAAVTYDFQYGIQNLSIGADVMNASQYQQFMQEAGVDITAPAGENYDTNWLDEISECAPMQRHNVTVSGGSDNSSYLVSGSYLKQDGAIGGENARFERYTFRVNTKSDVKSWLEIGNNLSFSHSKRNRLPEDDEYRSIVNSALLMDPFTPVIESDQSRIDAIISEGKTPLQNSEGDYYGQNRFPNGEVANPVAFIENTHDEEMIDKLLASFYGTLKPADGLSITSRVGVELNYTTRHMWTPKYFFSSERSNTSNVATDYIDKYYKTLWENFASYSTEVEDHSFTFLAGMSYEDFSHPDYVLESTMPKEGEQYAYHTYAKKFGDMPARSFFEENTKISYFGRLSYDYKERYMMEASIRRDGSSVLPTDNKWGTFKAISAGWIVTSEDFMQNANGISYLKLRASWGENGSIANVLNFPDIEFWTAMQGDTPIKYPNENMELQNGTRIKSPINPNLSWERSVQTDLGFDMRFFDDKFSFSADYFKKETDGLIAPKQLRPSMGAFNSPSANVGTIVNKGLEFEVSFRNQFDNGLKYNISANLSTLDNEVTEIEGGGTRLAGANVRGFDMTYFEEGYPVWYFYGWKTNGIDPATGEVNIVDVDGDGVTKQSDGKLDDDDRTYLGDPHPDLLYGATIGLEYKNWDFNMFLQGTSGNDIYMAWFRSDRTNTNKPEYFFTDRWTPQNTNASMPKPDNASDAVYRSDLMVADGSYMRIKQLQLGYTFPKVVVEDLGLSKLRAFVSLDDYFTFTNYKGMDPEAGSTEDNQQGIDKGLYPTTKKVMFGLSVKF